MSKKTHEEYENELKIKFPYIIPLELYAGSATKILHKCLKHNVEWEVTPNRLLNSRGCPQCWRESYTLKVAKSNDKYLEEVKIKNKNVLPLEPYINEKTKILHRCLLCGYEWKIAPGNVLCKHGCPKCSGNIGKTSEEYFEYVKKHNPNIEILEEYNVSKRNIKCRCKKHNLIWNADSANILRGGGCLQCGYEKNTLKRTKTNQTFLNELYIKNPNIVALKEYINSHTKITFQCLKCNNIWEAMPQDILKGHGCPKCNKSFGENKIEQWLQLNNIQYIPQYKFNDCCDINCLPFDFYLSEMNKCIEFDGIQHFEPNEYFGGQASFEYTQRHDQIKNEYCKTNNIPLLRIPYYANVEEELENFLFN